MAAVHEGRQPAAVEVMASPAPSETGGRAVRRGRLVLCGIATSGVVLSTVRQAADLDFGVTVLRDACADADDEDHRVLLDKVFPRQAEVVDVAASAASVAPAPAAPAHWRRAPATIW